MPHVRLHDIRRSILGKKAVLDCDIVAFPTPPKRSSTLLKNSRPECSQARRSKSIASGTMPNRFEPFMKANAIP